MKTISKDAIILSIVSGGKNETAVNVKTQFAKSRGRKLAYRSIGQGEPLILANRFRGNLDVWDPLFLDSLAKNYNVITFDYSGLGSSTGKAPVTILDFATDIKDLAEALGFKKIIAGGWSFGGFAVQILATEFPDLVSHTIVLGANPPGQNEHEIEPIFFETSRKPSYTVEDEEILFFEPTSEISRKAAKESHDRIAGRVENLDTRIPEELWDSYTTGITDFITDPYKSREKLHQLKTPVLVVTGDHDVCFPAENWYALTRKLPTTHLILFPQTGHGPQHQYPELTAKYIHDFIANIK